MSAAQWRRAMNSSASAAIARNSTAPAVVHPTLRPASSEGGLRRGLRSIVGAIEARHVIVIVALFAYPFLATPFFTYQIGAQSLALGLIALSLTFLGGYGGMVSLAQMTVAGFAAYMLAIFGASSNVAISLGWPWWLALIVAVSLATILAAAIGWLSVRTEGIYTIMITLAVGVAFFYLAQQNYTLFNGFQGFSRIAAPTLGELDLRQPVPFYFLVLACALAGYFFVKHLILSLIHI